MRSLFCQNRKVVPRCSVGGVFLIRVSKQVSTRGPNFAVAHLSPLVNLAGVGTPDPPLTGAERRRIALVRRGQGLYCAPILRCGKALTWEMKRKYGKIYYAVIRERCASYQVTFPKIYEKPKRQAQIFPVGFSLPIAAGLSSNHSPKP